MALLSLSEDYIDKILDDNLISDYKKDLLIPINANYYFKISEKKYLFL